MDKRLLIIDDEEAILSNLKSYLERKGFSVFCALKGEIGLELLRKENPDLLLLDLHLKEGIPGIEVLKQALNFNPNLKVAVLTGFGTDEDLKNLCLNLGAKLYLKKPLPLSAIREELEKPASL